MRLGISNIAWDRSEDEGVATLLGRHGVDAIDIAPGKYFKTPSEATTEDILDLKSWWANRGIEITGMQALLFGTSGLNVFGSVESQDAMRSHLGSIFRIAGILGARKLVFGSPKNRDREGLSDTQALDTAVSYFRKLGVMAGNEGVELCLEPNPIRYGANFMVTSAETARVVREIDHPAIRMQLDAGAMTINGEDPESVVLDNSKLIGHVHASEPDLVPLGDGETRHRDVAKAIVTHIPEAIVCIEMVATKDEPHLEAIERALAVAESAYGRR